MKKNIYRFVFTLLACVAAIPGCQDVYKEEYDTVELDYNKFNIAREGGRFSFMVYYSGDWTIRLDKEVDWVEFGQTSGSGVTSVDIYFKENDRLRRSFNMEVVGDGESKVITVTQAPVVDKVILEFAQNDAVDIAGNSGRVALRLVSNLPASCLETYVPEVACEGEDGWISNGSVESSSEETQIMDGMSVYIYDVRFDIAQNTGGASRTADITLKVTGEAGDSTEAGLRLVQGTEPGEVVMEDKAVCGAGRKEYLMPIDGGLGFFADMWEVEYDAEFIEAAFVTNGHLYFTLKENAGSEEREAEVSLTWQNGASKTVKVVQRETGIDAVIEINNAQELLEWNQNAKSWKSDDLVFLKADIDCKDVITSENWTPNVFKGTFDGDGKTIDNLVLEKEDQVAFFAKVESGAVRNLTFGAGCSFVTSKAASSSSRIYAASLAVTATGTATFAEVVNKGTVMAAAEATGGTKGNYIGGICASYGATGELVGCENYGEVVFSATPEAWMNCGGLFGEVTQSITVKGCINHGSVKFDGSNSGNKSLNVGGIVAGVNTAGFDSCVNLGSVSVDAKEKHKGETSVGGIVGLNKGAVLGDIINCVNGSMSDPAAGAVTNNTESENVLRIGGFAGGIVSGESDVAGFVNYGTISNNGPSTNWTGIGGVVGYISGLGAKVNTISGENHGTVLNTQVKGRVAVGGVVGFIQGSNTSVVSSRNAGMVKNTGKATHGVTVGGVVGRIEAATDGENLISLCENSGNVVFDAQSKDEALMSGVAGILGGHAGSAYSSGKYTRSSKITISGCTNSGDVTKSGEGSGNMHVGGIVAFLNGALEEGKDYTYVADLIDCTNAAEAEILNGSSGSGAWHTYTGGIVGYYRVPGEARNCKNYGSVKNTTESNVVKVFNAVRIGGIAGSAENGIMKDCVNAGAVADESDSNAGCVGGIAGYVATNAMTMTGCRNIKSVSGKFNSADNPYPVSIGGVIGYSAVETVLDGCDVQADITGARTTSASGMYLGGLIGQMAKVKMTLKNSNVAGDIVNETATNPTKTALGGLVGLCYTNEITDCHSKMSILNKCSVNEYVGGLVGQIEANVVTVMKDCSYSSTITSKKAQYSGMLVGRLTHKASSTTTISGMSVKGTFNGTSLTADNYKSYCFGTGSDYKNTDEVTFGTR